MNEPIISPWVFYFIGMTNPLLAISMVLTGAFGLFACFAWGSTSTRDEYYRERSSEEINKNYNDFKIFAFLFFLFLSIFILIPNESTCYKMLVAQNMTKQNVIDAGEAINNALDKAVDKIIKIQNESKENGKRK